MTKTDYPRAPNKGLAAAGEGAAAHPLPASEASSLPGCQGGEAREPRTESSPLENESQPVSLPDDLERFLPPHLWQGLAGGPMRRGLLLNGLERLRSILYLLSTYLPGELAQQQMRHPVAGQVRGELMDGSLLFSDVSGFTALSERLARTEGNVGAEQLTSLMNDYFARMLRIIAWSGGCLLKFAGDALLVYFPWQEDGRQAAWAVRASLRMMEDMERCTRSDARLFPGGDAGGAALSMKIGIGSGPFLAASVGSAQRMEYVVLGEAVERTMAAEELARTGQVVVDEATAGRLLGLELEPLPVNDAALAPAGFFLVRALPTSPEGEAIEQPLDDFEIKVERRRGRGAVPLSASTHAVTAQMETVLRQIQALVPFLAPELVERIVAGARQRHVAGEFRPTTVLFVNFTGVEALLDAEGGRPDTTGRGPGSRAAVSVATVAATRVLDEYFEAMEGIIRRHGGLVSRVDPYRRGSKMLVLFGAFVVHEDDPLRAVSAGLAMNDELAALNARWQRRHTASSAERSHGSKAEEDQPSVLPAPHIQHSIGITRGITFAGEVGSPTRREYTVMGDEVNLAARLMAAGEPGQILISQRVYDAVAEHLAAAALPAIGVKGKSQPIPIYQPLGPRDDPLARRLQHRKRLVGREAEAEAGRQAVRQALVGGERSDGGVLCICGPAGVGKSHLADELITYALARGARLLYVPCRSYHVGAPYHPWISAVRCLADVPADARPEDGRDRLLDRLRAWDLDPAEYGPPLCTLLGLPQPPAAAVLPAVGRPPAAESSTLFARLQEKVDRSRRDSRDRGTEAGLWQLMQQRCRTQPGNLWSSLQTRVTTRQEERLHCAVCGFIGRAAAEAPLLILIEDAHWLDLASRSLLDELARRVSSLPILVLVVGREGGDHATPAGPPGRRLELRLLDQAGTAALVGHLLAEAGVVGQPDSEAIERFHRQSDGNPLFIEEMIAAMQRAGKPQGQACGSLQDLVLSHLDALAPGPREISRVASIAGTDFPRGAIDALLSTELGKGAIDRHLADLEEQRLILLAQALPGEGGDATYSFRQALVRDIIYDSLSLARRRELHARYAAYLEAQLGLPGRVAGTYVGLAAVLDQAELLAHHYELARRPLAAARYSLLSAHKARERYAYGQALACYDRALAVLDELPAPGTEANRDPAEARLRAIAYHGRGDVALLTGDFRAAAAAYEAARSQLGDTGALRVGARLALVLPTLGRSADAEALARDLWADPAHDDLDGRLATAATLAWLLWRRGDPEVGDWIQRSRALLAGKTAGRGPWRAGIAALLDDLAGDWPAAQGAYLALDRPAGALLAACRQGDRYLAGGDAAAALVLYEQAADLGAEENDAPGLALARYRWADALARHGDTEAAIGMLAGALEFLEMTPPGDSAHSDAGDQDSGYLDSWVVQTALDALCAGGEASWPPWRWQAYDDALRISLIFCPGHNPEDLIPAAVRAASL